MKKLTGIFEVVERDLVINLEKNMIKRSFRIINKLNMHYQLGGSKNEFFLKEIKEEELYILKTHKKLQNLTHRASRF